MLKSISLTNFLSYGPKTTLDLLPLNVIIGPNGSGKSNLLEAIDLISSTPKDLIGSVIRQGGISDLIWKGDKQNKSASIELIVAADETLVRRTPSDLRYLLTFSEIGQRFEVVDEKIEMACPEPGHDKPYFFYHFHRGRGVLNVKGKQRSLKHEDIDSTQSILSQRKDPDQYPELTYLGNTFTRYKLFREWTFGRYTPPRLPQKADLPNDYLDPSANNLGLVLNRLRRYPETKAKIIESLNALYPGIRDYEVQVEGGTVQVFFQENNFLLPATRLSDGTLRFLCLLAILCHPTPPPLICIDEPELGLHPDVIPTLATLLKEYSQRSQVIVTTHSDSLVDAMSDSPEAILVSERRGDHSSLVRLDADALAPWLKKYRLGQLWTRGDLGGTRW